MVAKDVEHFKSLSAICSSSFETSILFCAPVLMGGDVSALSDVQLVKISSPSASCLFAPVVVSLCCAVFFMSFANRWSTLPGSCQKILSHAYNLKPSFYSVH